MFQSNILGMFRLLDCINGGPEGSTECKNYKATTKTHNRYYASKLNITTPSGERDVNLFLV